MQPYRTPIRTELELRRLVSELSLLRTELNSKPKTDIAFILSNPTWLAVLGAIVSVATGFWQLQANRQLEREKLRSTLIQEASKSGSPETTLKNLKFLVKVGLVEDEKGAIAALKLDDAPSFVLLPAAPLTRAEMLENFGDPKLKPKPGEDGSLGLADPDEAWVAANLIDVELPALANIPGFPKSGKIKFHRKAEPHLQAAIAELSQKGLIPKIRSFDGAWVPRTVRGSAGTYSAHAYGIAFDINAKFNQFGKPSPTANEEGSNADLIDIFENHGFYWGGRFHMPDAGHFQYGIASSTVNVAASSAGKAAR